MGRMVLFRSAVGACERLRRSRVSAAVLAIGLVAGCGGQSPAAQAAAQVASAAPPPRVDGRLPGGVSPVSYDLDFSFDPSGQRFQGRASISLAITEPTRTIVMHARDLNIERVTLRRDKESWTGHAVSRQPAHSKGEAEELVIGFPEVIPRGPAELEIRYSAPFAPGLHGMYTVEESGKHFAFTQLEPTEARRVFPGFDEPSFKVPITVHATVPDGNVVFSNTPLANTTHPKPGWVRFDFETSNPMPTYLVALAAGPLETYAGPDDVTDIRVIAVPNKAELGASAAQTASTQLRLLSEYFGSEFPHEKLDLVAVPNFAPGAMENTGLVTFREEIILLDPEHASTRSRRLMAQVMAHELAHMWFGNLVTMEWWDDLWLNEAFANWVARRTVDQSNPEFGAGIDFLRAKNRVMGLDWLASARRVRQPVRSTSEANEVFEAITYVKGESVLSMIERWVGPATFQEGVRAHLKEHAWGTGTSEQLFEKLEKASKKPVGDVASSFIDQAGVPRVNIEMDCSPDVPPRVVLSQQELRPIGSSPVEGKYWQIPVCLRYPVEGDTQPDHPDAVASSGSGAGATIVQCELLGPGVREIALNRIGCPAWIYPNADEAGYYRFHMRPHRLYQLARAAGQLSPLERAGLIGNSWALVESGGLTAERYLEMLVELPLGEDRVVWQQVFDSLIMIDMTLEPSQRPAFSRYARRLLEPLVAKLGWVSRPQDSGGERLLRQRAIELLGWLADDKKAQARLFKLAEAWLSDPDSADPDLVVAAVRVTARKRGDRELFDRLVVVLQDDGSAQRRVTALRGLASFRDPELARRALDLWANGTLKMQDLHYIISPVAADRATARVAYAWLKENLSEMSEGMPPFLARRVVSVTEGLCDQGSIREAKRFLSVELQEVEGADRRLREASEQGMICHAFRSAQVPAIARWLRTAAEAQP
jgi:cytosol alanyl aminopeptidase